MGQKGLTIVELISVLVLMSVIVVALTQLYLFGVTTWQGQHERQVTNNRISQSLERLSRSLRQAQSLDAFSESSISFTADLGDGPRAYRAYLYHTADGEPNPPYSQESYELRLAADDVQYGDGAVLASGIHQPASALFVRSGDLISIDLTAGAAAAPQRWRAAIQLRNL